MDLETLVHMANRIGEFFAAMPDRDEAREGVALHIQRYWAPPMRKTLFERLDEARAMGLQELVVEAVRSKRQMLAAG